MLREIIQIDEDLCNGCGNCVPACHEGALQIIDGKARVISDLMCDGLGACVGHCPTGAMEVVKREAEPYDEAIIHGNNQGPLMGKAEKLKQLQAKFEHHHAGGGCPGSKMMQFDKKELSSSVPTVGATALVSAQSELRQWPVQLHLLNPQAPYFTKADVVLAADCTAYALGDFHNRFMKDKTLAIACPKLDSNQETYVSKIQSMIDNSQINTLSVVMMEVPCCSGLLQMAQIALAQAQRKIPIKKIIVGIEGDIKGEEWVLGSILCLPKWTV